MADYEVGDTIRVRAVFRDWTAEGGPLGAAVTATDVKVNLYHADQAELASDLVPVNEGVGTYYYDWTLPLEAGSYFIEFTGQVNGKTQLSRRKIKTKWDVA